MLFLVLLLREFKVLESILAKASFVGAKTVNGPSA
jgi:hypothetical protein